MILFLNNQVGARVLRLCVDESEQIECVVHHPREKAKCLDEILGICREAQISSCDFPEFRKKLGEKEILGTDWGLSVYFGYILTEEMISLFSESIVNLHPSYLPFNRGAYSNVWPILDGTPAGVTLHAIDKGIDTGDVFAQEEVVVLEWDTSETLYRKLEDSALMLFKKNWKKIRGGEVRACPQNGKGTFHRIQDVGSIDKIDLSKTLKSEDLLRLLRARSFKGHRGAYFQTDRGKVYLHLTLDLEEDGQES